MSNIIKYSVNDDSSINSLISLNDGFTFSFEDGTTLKNLGSISLTNTINITSLLNNSNADFYISSIEASLTDTDDSYTNDNISSQLLSGISITYGSPSTLVFTIIDNPNITDSTYYFKIVLTQYPSNKEIVLKFNAINFDGSGTYDVFGKYTEFGDPVDNGYRSYTANCDCTLSSFYMQSYSTHGQINFSVTSENTSDDLVKCSSITQVKPQLYLVDLAWNSSYNNLINAKGTKYYMSKSLTFTQYMGSKEITITFNKRYSSKYRTLIFENSSDKTVCFRFRNAFFQITDTNVDEGFLIGLTQTDVTVGAGQNATCNGYFYQQSETDWNMKVWYRWISEASYMIFDIEQSFQWNTSLTYDAGLLNS